ncbi:type II secretion system F family protein [Lacisediminihabitans sp. G11-30]|uniref:Type II secretion system F family protein n=1 Tax=Lacisediminihabitans changchengi TaxID=2787634 RepID=A0A934SIQ4_9MICO|nr:type II secretion system F family protein [Lacisediminihabitans changchengi]
MTPLTAWSILLGLSLGLGLWSLASMLPRLSRPRLIHRVAPYLVDVSPGARELLARRSVEPLPVVGALLSPLTGRARALLGRLLGGPTTIELRLRQSGTSLTVDEFRARQLVWGVSGAGLGLLLSIALARTSGLPFAIHLLIVAGAAVAGVVLRDYLLQRAAKRRVERIREELPTVLEFLTLSLSAGEGILDAIRRVAGASHGELAQELSRVISAVNTGLPLAESLTGLASALQLAPLSRAVDHITGALERGTPLAEVLRAQAQDARDDAKRELLEVAGKKEVAMMVPLVFLILPMTVIFAIFPGIAVLQMGF